MDKVKQIPDFYTDRISPIHFSAFMYLAGEHEMRGGEFVVFVPVAIQTIFHIPLPIGKVGIYFSDRCTCPIPYKDKCNVLMPLILCKN